MKSSVSLFLFFLTLTGLAVGAVRLNGTSSVDFNFAGVVLPTTSTAATVSAFITPTTSGDQRVITFGSGTSTHFGVVWGRTANKFSCFGRTSAPALIQVDTARTFTTGVTYHVACVAMEPTISIYVNGNLEASSGSFSTAQAFGQLSTSQLQTCRFGMPSRATNVAFNGFIDDVTLFNRALSTPEILTQSQSNGRNTITDGLLAYWPLDEGFVGIATSSTSVIDRSGRGQNNIGALGFPVYSASRLSLP